MKNASDAGSAGILPAARGFPRETLIRRLCCNFFSNALAFIAGKMPALPGYDLKKMKKFALNMRWFFLAVFLFLPAGCEKAPEKTAGKNRAVPGMALIPGGVFQMGTDGGMPFEGPIHTVEVKSFWIDENEVTVAEFAKFVEATNYKTEAEKFGWSGVFNMETGEWERTDGANWRYPDGAGSEAKPDEPVCQVSWNDAAAYAKWAGKRLPTEAEWEFAARGGFAGKKYSWGDELRPNGKPVANWWQGSFPEINTGEDNFMKRAPVRSFAPNGYGLYDMAGNVWEWNADWYADDYYKTSPGKDPGGAKSGEERVIRGGSWMCAENFCSNYRVAARSHATPDSGLNNLGFRCARDAQ